MSEYGNVAYIHLGAIVYKKNLVMLFVGKLMELDTIFLDTIFLDT
jgi:hypothetical protein